MKNVSRYHEQRTLELERQLAAVNLTLQQVNQSRKRMATEHADEINGIIRVKRERIDIAEEQANDTLEAKRLADEVMANVTKELKQARELVVECVICLVNKPNMLYSCGCICTCSQCPSVFRDNACPRCRKPFKSKGAKPKRVHV
jgi:small-conductance mechanosensitive channel